MSAWIFVVVVAVFAASFADAQYTCTFDKYDLTPMAGETASLLWSPAEQNTITFSVCGSLSTTCGTTPDDQCYQRTGNCTSACQTWLDASNGPEGASLGFYTSNYNVTKYSLTLLYTNGDQTYFGNGRQVYIDLACGLGGLTITNFIQAIPPPPPNGAPFSYYIYATHYYMCKYFKPRPPPPPPQCTYGSYDLSPLAGMTASLTWAPNQNISIAVCGTLATTCGSRPSNQCASSSSNCTSACQTWGDPSNGPQGASLGYFSNFFKVGKYSITLLYIDGDVTELGVGRQAFVELGCGSQTSLTITNFTQAIGPPPPNGEPYSYFVTATHKYLCKYFNPLPPVSM
jgi:hypothetical protein